MIRVGEHLAEFPLGRSHGKRPISLTALSLEARVIYHRSLARGKRSDSAGIVEDVILLEAPVSASSQQWKQLCTVLGRRVINALNQAQEVDMKKNVSSQLGRRKRRGEFLRTSGNSEEGKEYAATRPTLMSLMF
ncbi:unnamed protein product [Haemonchus placei]|uniref:Uncharacterized protein n=1 Tax=Haemonchus placei TaxID=6290 RepID=A0A0N4WXI2_HAEPC|nr:unnamed protein product [Haemonchus placei]